MILISFGLVSVHGNLDSSSYGILAISNICFSYSALKNVFPFNQCLTPKMFVLSSFKITVAELIYQGLSNDKLQAKSGSPLFL